jgi:aspartyl-tRNA(Asn)/glutamyl-tRNA(Gln) amidotransferase subunit A
MEIWQLSAAELTRQYRARQLSPVEVVWVVLDRIEALNPQLNAYLAVAAEHAIAAARDAERAWSHGDDQPALCGVPVSVKDTIEVAGMTTTYGSLAFADHVAPDSQIARRLRAAGSAIVGKTNTSEFALSTHTHNRLGAPARNPWASDRSAGGSSGGAAAAVAAGLGPIAIGTDSAGSIRLPAAYNGVFGFKPTFDLIPAVQQWRASPTRSHNGPLTRTVADAALAIEALANRPGLAASAERDSDGIFAGQRVAVIDGTGDRRGAHRLRAVIEEAGAQVVDVDRPPPTPPPAEIGDGIWAFSGDHYAAAEKVRPGFWAKHAQQLTDYAMPIYRDGQSALAWRYRTVLDLTQQYAASVAAWFDAWDFAITPCAAPAIPQPASAGDLGPRFATLTMWNLAGNPAASLPMGFDEDSMPLAAQLVARRGYDSVLLAACRHIEQHAPWGQAWPDTAHMHARPTHTLKEGS